MVSPPIWDDNSEAHLIPANMHPEYTKNQMMHETGLNMSKLTGTTTMPMVIQEGNYKTQGVFYKNTTKSTNIGTTPDDQKQRRNQSVIKQMPPVSHTNALPSVVNINA